MQVNDTIAVFGIVIMFLGVTVRNPWVVLIGLLIGFGGVSGVFIESFLGEGS